MRDHLFTYFLIIVYLIAIWFILRYFKNRKTTEPYSSEWYNLVKGLVMGILLMIVDLSLLYLN